MFRYEFYSWKDEFNGSIYYNYQSAIYLAPWISSSTGHKQYIFTHNASNTDSVYAYCKIPTHANPMSPYNCYNDHGYQLKSYVYPDWMYDDTASLRPCQGILFTIKPD